MNWWSDFINQDIEVKHNSSTAFLIEQALKKSDDNQLSSNGSLTIKTGSFTGRAADDKYVVVDNFTEQVIDWKNHIRKMSLNHFNKIKNEILADFNTSSKTLYATTCSVGADVKHALEVKTITDSPAHALFTQNIFRAALSCHPLGSFTIYHSPDLILSDENYNLRSKTVIAINFSTSEIIIVGTGYAGEIKKSIFSVMNTLLPEKNVLPMHTGANCDQDGRTSLFFGLSGTGKTTLSTDTNLNLIGDDEHGLSDDGIFNFEGGCYAKTYNLKQESEPEIFAVSNRFGSLLENVVLDPQTRLPLYEDKSITENGRATYKLSSLQNVISNSTGAIPQNIFFLSADALGVLPAISKLTPEQAMFYFLTGYTAKLAGTEIGLKGITTTFSHCFGAPFMMRRSSDYGELLKKLLEKHKIDVWLVNTGWYGGSYGEGKRYPLSFTRSCIRQIQQGLTSQVHFTTDPVFSLSFPINLSIENNQLLNPMESWQDKEKYLATAQELNKKFHENFKKII